MGYTLSSSHHNTIGQCVCVFPTNASLVGDGSSTGGPLRRGWACLLLTRQRRWSRRRRRRRKKSVGFGGEGEKNGRGFVPDKLELRALGEDVLQRFTAGAEREGPHLLCVLPHHAGGTREGEIANASVHRKLPIAITILRCTCKHL